MRNDLDLGWDDDSDRGRHRRARAARAGNSGGYGGDPYGGHADTGYQPRQAPRFDPHHEQRAGYDDAYGHYEEPYDGRYEQQQQRYQEPPPDPRYAQRYDDDDGYDGGLPFGEPETRRGRREGKGRGGRTFLALFITLIILSLLGAGAWFGFDKVRDVFAAPDYNTGGSGEVVVEVKKGQSASAIGAELQAKDVVKSQKAFIKAADSNPRSREIQPGFYKMRKQMRAADALALILDRTSRWVWQAKIIDGWSYKRTFAELSKVTGIPVAEFEAAAKDPIALGVPDYWFNRRDKKPAVKSIEGFLFPDTYEFAPNSTATDILKEMVGQFIKVVTELNLTTKVEGELKVSPFEALIVASLAQAEAGIKEDLPHIARVAYNRVYKANMPLEFDVTANYWLELNGKDPKHSGQLTPQELDDPKNPYNTKSVRGLPVGPINSPSRAALEAAMSPTPGKAWLFFVAIDKSGRSAFADTLAEHNRNIAQACRNGIPLCG